jgi:hypothetical protein
MRLILVGCALALAMTGPAFAEQRNLSGFTKVSANSGTDVTVVVGSGFSIDVSGPGADRVITRISGDTLVVERRSGFTWGATPRADVRVTMPRVHGLSAASGADLIATNVDADTIELDSSSGADARVFATGRLNVEASSGGGVVVHGNPGIGDVDLSSGGSMRRAS